MTGYTFKGWFYDAEYKNEVEKNSSGKYYIPKTFVPVNGESVTVYAKWAADDLTVTFNANVPTGTATAITSTGSMTPQAFKYGVETTLKANAFRLSDTSYSFAGWTTSAAPNVVTYADGQAITLTSSVELLAVWATSETDITVTLNTGGFTFTDLDSTVWSAGSTAGTYTAASFKHGAAATPKLPATGTIDDNHSFGGWVVTSDATGRIITDSNINTLVGAVTLTAKSVPNSYKAIYNDNIPVGATATKQRTKTEVVEYGSLWMPATSAATVTGYTFDHWATKDANGTQKDLAQAPKNWDYSGDQTFYAVWTADKAVLNLYTEYGDFGSFSLGTQSGSVGAVTFTYGYSDTNKGKITLPTAKQMGEAGFDGMKFKGWFKSGVDANGNYTYLPAGSQVKSVKYGDTTQYVAKWAGKYTINYNGIGNDPTAEKEQSRTLNTSKALMSMKNLKNAYFLGWATEPNSTDVVFKNKAKVSNLTLDAAGVDGKDTLYYELYAVYVDKLSEYNVTFYDANGNVIAADTFKYSKGYTKKQINAVISENSLGTGYFVNAMGIKTAAIAKKTAGDQVMTWIPTYKVTKAKVKFANGANQIGTKVSGKIAQKVVKSTAGYIPSSNKFKADGYSIQYFEDPNGNRYFLTDSGNISTTGYEVNAGVLTGTRVNLGTLYAGNTVTLTAVWSNDAVGSSYTIFYDAQGGTMTVVDPAVNGRKLVIYNETDTNKIYCEDYTLATAAHTLATPTRAGYIFGGWTEDGAKTTAGTTGVKVRYLTATWSQIQ